MAQKKIGRKAAIIFIGARAPRWCNAIHELYYKMAAAYCSM